MQLYSSYFLGPPFSLSIFFRSKRRTSSSPFYPQGELIREAWLGKQTVQKSGHNPFDQLKQSKYQKRLFKLYPGLLLYYSQVDYNLAIPDAIVPMETIIFSAHAVKEMEGKRLDLILQAKQEQWIMSLKADSKEQAAEWVEAIKKEREEVAERAKVKKIHPHLRYVVEGKFWKEVNQMSITYHRRTHTRNPRKSAIALSSALRTGILSRKLASKGLLGKPKWEQRECQLYLDTLVERRTKNNSSVTSTIFLRDVQTVACRTTEPGILCLTMKDSFSGEDTLEYKTSGERDAAAWLQSFQICLKRLQPLPPDKKQSLSAQESGKAAFEAGDYKTALGFFQQAAK